MPPVDIDDTDVSRLCVGDEVCDMERDVEGADEDRDKARSVCLDVEGAGDGEKVWNI